VLSLVVGSQSNARNTMLILADRSRSTIHMMMPVLLADVGLVAKDTLLLLPPLLSLRKFAISS
jgi:hypothetical protein